MTWRVYKYKILPDKPAMQLHKGSEILHVGVQNREFYLWALVNPEEHVEVRLITVYGTGWPINMAFGSYKHLGTIQEDGFVWHIFEEGIKFSRG
jgi:hypothetical protein